MVFLAEFFKKKAQYTPRSGEVKIAQDYKRLGKTIHVLCESNDDFEFYVYVVQHHYRGFKICPYDQKGKANVLEVFRELDWNRYSKSRVLFFVDKDYDDLIDKQPRKATNLFITKHYSIENYFVDAKTLEVILKRVYQLSDMELKSLGVINNFIKAHEDFNRQMIPITCCILIYRALAARMDLDALKMDSFFYFNGMSLYPKRFLRSQLLQNILRDLNIPGHVKAQYFREKKKDLILRLSCADPAEIQIKTLILNLRKLQKIKEPKAYVRGKYELWFLMSYLSNFEIANSQVKSRRRFELTTHNFFDLLSPKIEMPLDIIQFVKANRGKERIKQAVNGARRLYDHILFKTLR